jgi:toxin ParE1/3/4
MKVRFSSQAFADREQIFEYLHARSPSGAHNVLASIREAVALLADQPYSGYPTDDPEVRVKFVVRYPYKIFYRVRDDVVEIVHIRHTSRRPWSGAKRHSQS